MGHVGDRIEASIRQAMNRAGFPHRDRQAVTNVIAARTDLSQAEAEQLAMRVENALSSAQTRIASTIDTVTESAGEVAAIALQTAAGGRCA